MGKSFLIKHVVEQATAKLNCRVIVHDLEAVARRQVTHNILYAMIYIMLHHITNACTSQCIYMTNSNQLQSAVSQLYTVHTVSSSMSYSVHHICRHFVCSSS
jgi:hypothetical protein